MILSNEFSFQGLKCRFSNHIFIGKALHAQWLINEGNLKVKDVITDEIELNDIVESGFEQLVNDRSQSKILVKL